MWWVKQCGGWSNVVGGVMWWVEQCDGRGNVVGGAMWWVEQCGGWSNVVGYERLYEQAATHTLTESVWSLLSVSLPECGSPGHQDVCSCQGQIAAYKCTVPRPCNNYTHAISHEWH